MVLFEKYPDKYIGINIVYGQKLEENKEKIAELCEVKNIEEIQKIFIS